MRLTFRPDRHRRHGQAGQSLVIAVAAILAFIAMVALVIDGGNAYGHQRSTQNGTDAAANAGALALAANLSGKTYSTSDVEDQVRAIADANAIPTFQAWFTDVYGRYLTAAGTPTPDRTSAAVVGTDPIPSGAQGVAVSASQQFDTSFARVIGIEQLTATAEATAVTGPLTGGAFLPVVFPVNIVDCETNGDLGAGEDSWELSQPGEPPDGPEYIVPLCKTGGGNFMILDLDPTLSCSQELETPPIVQWDAFPVEVAADNGNDCATKILPAIQALAGHVVLVPICVADCVTEHGSHATYWISKVAAFYLDPVQPMSDQNGGVNPACQAGISASGHDVTPIAGNGSDSCLIGWFVRWITQGPVGTGPIGNSDALGVQLIK